MPSQVRCIRPERPFWRQDRQGGRIGSFSYRKIAIVRRGTIGERIPGELSLVGKKYDKFAKENPGAAAKWKPGLIWRPLGLVPFKASKIGSKVSKAGDKVGDIGRAKLMTSEMLHKKSSAAYDAAEKAGGFLDPSVTDDFLYDIMEKIEAHH